MKLLRPLARIHISAFRSRCVLKECCSRNQKVSENVRRSLLKLMEGNILEPTVKDVIFARRRKNAKERWTSCWKDRFLKRTPERSRNWLGLRSHILCPYIAWSALHFKEVLNTCFWCFYPMDGRPILSVHWGVQKHCRCDALSNMIPFVQFKKREKQPWSSITFIKVASWSLQLY